MRIRTILIASFLTATLVPTAIFGWLSYQTNAARQFDEVKERHLLHAQNASMALERYYVDLVATFASISDALIIGQQTPNLEALMRSIRLACVLIVDTKSGQVLARTDVTKDGIKNKLSAPFLKTALQTTVMNKTQFSGVIASKRYGNVILGVRHFGDKLAVAIVTTEYFKVLASSISFGEKGHAAIVDQAGKVLAHPRPEWVAERKNISNVSAVARMMNGETGVERFYSPAQGKEMIAGLATVPNAGWGVMIPQPVQELYDKAYQDTKTVLVVVAVGLILTFGFVLLLLDSLAFPIEGLLLSLRKNVAQMPLTKSVVKQGIIPLREISQLSQDYNIMVERVSAANTRISSLAFSDLVTGLPNRARLREFTERVIDENVDNLTGTLTIVDLDNFKQINDVYGHAIGDQFLQECALKLKKAIAREQEEFPIAGHSGEPPIIARIGGDEFAIVYPGLSNTGDLQSFLSRLQAELATPSEGLKYIAKWGASLGCARFPTDADNMEELTKYADLAMYQAKKEGRNRYQIYNRNIGTQTASELIVEIERAIQNDELHLEYQPKVGSKETMVVGVEALVRWIHPEKGSIPPNEWIPVISNSTTIEELGEWVVARAMDDQLRWKAGGLDLDVSVNIASKHFSSPNFVKRLKRVAQTKNFEASRMEIEITEDALFSTPQDATAAIQKLKESGFKIAIDDFGSGYSNFARLSELNVDTLKIDRSIVFSSRHNERVRSMLDCIIVMAKTLGCQTVAEGVETSQDVERMVSMGIPIVQGYYYSASISAEELPRWVASHSAQAEPDAIKVNTGSRNVAA